MAAIELQFNADDPEHMASLVRGVYDLLSAPAAAPVVEEKPTVRKGRPPKAETAPAPVVEEPPAAEVVEEPPAAEVVEEPPAEQEAPAAGDEPAAVEPKGTSEQVVDAVKGLIAKGGFEAAKKILAQYGIAKPTQTPPEKIDAVLADLRKALK